jgi:hypothetical protein
MPFGDRTGPLGLGPRTGRGMGYCSGYLAPGSMNPLLGRGGLGFGRRMGGGFFGRGRGWRNCFWATGLPGWERSGYGYPPYGPGFMPKEEVDILRDQAEFLKQQLDDIQERISKLEKTQVKESE